MEFKKVHYNYEMTSFINRVVGNQADSTNVKGLIAQLGLVRSEINEGLSHLGFFLSGKEEALRDDVADILFTTYGLLHRLGATPIETELGGGSDEDLVAMSLMTNFERIVADKVKVNLPVLSLPDVVLPLSFAAQKATALQSYLEEHLYQGGISREHVLTECKWILLYTYYLGYLCYYPVDEDYAAVVQHNITKFDSTKEDALDTQLKYGNLGVETEITVTVVTFEGKETPWFITKSSKDQTGTDGKSYPKGKWVKSINTKGPFYSPLVKE